MRELLNAKTGEQSTTTRIHSNQKFAIAFESGGQP
jgi:hypothetical protein